MCTIIKVKCFIKGGQNDDYLIEIFTLISLINVLAIIQTSLICLQGKLFDLHLTLQFGNLLDRTFVTQPLKASNELMAVSEYAQETVDFFTF